MIGVAPNSQIHGGPCAQTPGGKLRYQHQRSRSGAGHTGMPGLLFNEKHPLLCGGQQGPVAVVT